MDTRLCNHGRWLTQLLCLLLLLLQGTHGVQTEDNQRFQCKATVWYYGVLLRTKRIFLFSEAYIRSTELQLPGTNQINTQHFPIWSSHGWEPVSFLLTGARRKDPLQDSYCPFRKLHHLTIMVKDHIQNVLRPYSGVIATRSDLKG